MQKSGLKSYSDAPNSASVSKLYHRAQMILFGLFQKVKKYCFPHDTKNGMGKFRKWIDWTDFEIVSLKHWVQNERW